jgi:hypothetical protein
MKLRRCQAGELPTDASVPEHPLRGVSQLQPGGQDRFVLSRSASIGLLDGHPDFRTSTNSTRHDARLRPGVDVTSPAGRLPLAHDETAGSANDTTLRA